MGLGQKRAEDAYQCTYWNVEAGSRDVDEAALVVDLKIATVFWLGYLQREVDLTVVFGKHLLVEVAKASFRQQVLAV